MVPLKNLNLGLIEVIPRKGNYSSYKEFLADYSRETPNSEGIRISDYLESRYLLRELGNLKLNEFLKNYYYSIVTEIVGVVDPFGTGGYKDIIIDDPDEIIKFQNGETAFGYGDSGNEYEVEKGSAQLIHWDESESVFFLVRSI
jgi:hypothetical protein